jgi:hypothetical protein
LSVFDAPDVLLNVSLKLNGALDARVWWCSPEVSNDGPVPMAKETTEQVAKEFGQSGDYG